MCYKRCDEREVQTNSWLRTVYALVWSTWQLLKATVTQWIEHQPFQLASLLSYYTPFSLAPLLIIVIGIAGFAFGRAAPEQQIVGTIEGMIGQQSAEAV
jgi:membrane protein